MEPSGPVLVLGHILVLAGQLMVAFGLVWLLVRSPYGRCCKNWLLYRHWTPCQHPVQAFRPAPRDDSGAEVFEFACLTCGTVFIRDTWANWEAECTRLPWWTRACQAIRRFLSVCALLALLTGCADAVYWWSRTSVGLDCRPEVIKQHQGQCVSVAKGK